MIKSITTRDRVRAYETTFGSLRMNNMPKIIKTAGYEQGMRLVMGDGFDSLDVENKNKVFQLMESCVRSSRRGIGI